MQCPSLHEMTCTHYQAGEKDKEDNLVDAFGSEDATSIKNEELSALKRDLASKASADKLDGFGYYL